ncbi:MAG: hypothetical protein ACYCYR_01780 [Desulfobulbaceae bacterium]
MRRVGIKGFRPGIFFPPDAQFFCLLAILFVIVKGSDGHAITRHARERSETGEPITRNWRQAGTRNIPSNIIFPMNQHGLNNGEFNQETERKLLCKWKVLMNKKSIIFFPNEQGSQETKLGGARDRKVEGPAVPAVIGN